MRRSLRWTFNAIMVAWPVLCLAYGVSYFHRFVWTFSAIGVRVSWELHDGALYGDAWRFTTLNTLFSSRWDLGTSLFWMTLVPAIWLLDRIFGGPELRHPPMRGICASCGYDLRATPDASELLDRCPECGQARAQAAAAVERLNP